MREIDFDMLDIYYNVSSMTNTSHKSFASRNHPKSALLLFPFTNIQRQIIFLLNYMNRLSMIQGGKTQKRYSKIWIFWTLRDCNVQRWGEKPKHLTRINQIKASFSDRTFLTWMKGLRFPWRLMGRAHLHYTFHS